MNLLKGFRFQLIRYNNIPNINVYSGGKVSSSTAHIILVYIKYIIYMHIIVILTNKFDRTCSFL